MASIWTVMAWARLSGLCVGASGGSWHHPSLAAMLILPRSTRSWKAISIWMRPRTDGSWRLSSSHLARNCRCLATFYNGLTQSFNLVSCGQIHLTLSSPSRTVFLGGGHYNASSTIKDTFYGLIHGLVAGRYISNTDHGPSRFVLRQMLAFYHAALVLGNVERDGQSLSPT